MEQISHAGSPQAYSYLFSSTLTNISSHHVSRLSSLQQPSSLVLTVYHPSLHHHLDPRSRQRLSMDALRIQHYYSSLAKLRSYSSSPRQFLQDISAFK